MTKSDTVLVGYLAFSIVNTAIALTAAFVVWWR
jgi:hypothetical protein